MNTKANEETQPLGFDTTVVIDAGVGNLGNLVRALHRVGTETWVTSDPEVVVRARRMVLPGVGAFRPPRERLKTSGLEEALRQALDQGAYLLGICIGFQLLFESSQEFGAADGLCLLQGHLERLPASVAVPQIGWNELHELDRSHPLLDGLPDRPFVYFVHSFAPVGTASGEELALCTHGRPFAAVAGRGRVVGTQFHPEKSGVVGLRLLRNYLELSSGGRELNPGESVSGRSSL